MPGATAAAQAPASVGATLDIIVAFQRTEQAQQSALVETGGLGQVGEGEMLLGRVEGLEYRQGAFDGFNAILCHAMPLCLTGLNFGRNLPRRALTRRSVTPSFLS